MRSVKISPGEFYHIYNRGVEKRNIFLDTLDYDRFVMLLVAANNKESFHLGNIKNTLKSEFKGLETCLELRNETLVDIGAWCLMPNHFHILLKEKEDGGVAKFMQKILTGYTMYFNKKNNRSGVLFEGGFKAEHADSDDYLKYLFSYIHLNPVKLIDLNWKENGISDVRKALKYLDLFERSSYRDYLGYERVEKGILNCQSFPEYFPGPDDFRKEIIEWLNYKK